jgi:ArsR family transcriptional regulator
MKYVNKPSLTDLAMMFKALGDPTRLRIFEFLRTCSESAEAKETGGVHTRGPTAGEVCCCITGLTRINSTISHHLKELELAGLICVERRGKNRVCRVNWEAVDVLVNYLVNDKGTMDGRRK